MEKIIDEETVKFLKEVNQALTKFDMKLTALKVKLNNNVDYKELLKRYIVHIQLCEGFDFIPSKPDNSMLTDSDRIVLRNLLAE